MGLHDSFSQVRGQLLLIDPLPPIKNFLLLFLKNIKEKLVFMLILLMILPIPWLLLSKIMIQKDLVIILEITTLEVTILVVIKEVIIRIIATRAGYKGYRKERPFCTH